SRDWSSDVCSSDLADAAGRRILPVDPHGRAGDRVRLALRAPSRGHGETDPRLLEEGIPRRVGESRRPVTHESAMKFRNPFDTASLARARGLDAAFRWATYACGAGVLLLLLGIFAVLLHGGWPAFRELGAGFFTRATWNPVRHEFGVLAPVYGTL